MIKLVKYVKPYLREILLVIALIFVRVMCDLYLPNLMSDAVNNGVTNGDVDYILRIGLTMLAVSLIGTLCSVASSYFSARNSSSVGRDMRNDIFAKVESFSQKEFDKFTTASLITRTTNDVQQMQMVVMFSQRMLASTPLMLVGSLINAMNKDMQLLRILLVTMPILVILILSIMRFAMPLFQAGQKKLDRLNQVLREGLSGVRVIRAFNRDSYQTERFQDANFDLTANAIKVNRIMASMMPLMMLIMNLTTIAVVWYGSQSVDEGIIMVGDLMAFSQYVMMILFSLLDLSMIFIMFPRAEVSAQRIVDVLETEPDVVEPASPVSLPRISRGMRLEFNHVTFRYPGGEEPALSDITFTIEPGETAAIIGSTGSGKSTIGYMIQRFYDCESGSITADGLDVRTIALEDLRQQIGYVPQRAVLFSGSIAENLRYGDSDASETLRSEALSIAQASEFVSTLPEGEEAFVAQGGSNFSGGQKQRLSIARALVRQPRLFVFDDSFSALDYKTDLKLRQALNEQTAEATKLIIAQRVSTIMQADRIIVLNDGAIVGIGTHSELLRSCVVYQEIVRSQLSEAEIA